MFLYTTKYANYVRTGMAHTRPKMKIHNKLNASSKNVAKKINYLLHWI